ncbi:MAG TPA: nucleoside triphosphate hydrolase [Gammaproteobacteria bacterium]|jgi:8-oxo-dGTP pyrophosphatase MutT (NUDIX family)|nr:NUDIX hydrolase [Litorivicinaceae bacterium]MDB2402399.1 NUDIX hydrolase [Litorivicinaceae bacterium]HAB68766.1 nucleoside triphosphate hydrolase [Gammaproteobacteria bacterium]HAB77276.1 nucleoside triphosphate hydrolase [Gammaproteobacteria bacterium]HBC49293.1 nucleoside triphosphate hydrolase [Gammaproteobacteria bacterium]
MDRQQLLRQLTAHRPIDNHEAGFLKRTQQFVASTPHCFERSYLNGHVTGSAWIVSPDRTHAILLHHQKLDRWFQPGGHADGEPDILKVAMTEAQEETGLSANQLTIISHRIFDIDVHRIPARPGEPTHDHFDIRFLFEASPDIPLPGNHESHAVRWFPLDEVQVMNHTASCHRMVIKTRQLRDHSAF